MSVAYICEGFRTPIGRYGGALAQIRTDDLAAAPLAALREKFVRSDWESLDEIVLGCTNQAGEDNRNVARMASLLAGIPHTVPAMTVNRLCGSGMEAVAVAARAIAADEISLAIAGGVESMSRAPMVIPKAYSAFSGEEVWHRLYARDSRERRRRLSDRPMLAGQLRSSLAAKGCQGSEGRNPRPGDRACSCFAT